MTDPTFQAGQKVIDISRRLSYLRLIELSYEIAALQSVHCLRGLPKVCLREVSHAFSQSFGRIKADLNEQCSSQWLTSWGCCALSPCIFSYVISVCCGSLFPSFHLSSSFSFHPFLQGWIHNSPFLKVLYNTQNNTHTGSVPWSMLETSQCSCSPLILTIQKHQQLVLSQLPLPSCTCKLSIFFCTAHQE